MTRKTTAVNSRKPSVAFVGAGRLASFLAPALKQAGYRIIEIVTRNRRRSRLRAQALAKKVKARLIPVGSPLHADLVWFAVPDGEIRPVAAALERSRAASKLQFAFHSSGALSSRELDPLHKAGVAVASVHPLMTFVPRAHPSLRAVPFTLEGDRTAIAAARKIVRNLGADSLVLHAHRKPAYHAWATMTSPLLVAYLVALEEAARYAGLSRVTARRLSHPIVRQTITNYARLGPAHSFSGPFIRGDASTVSRHLSLLKKNAGARQVYAALARIALEKLPARNRKELARLLENLES